MLALREILRAKQRGWRLVLQLFCEFLACPYLAFPFAFVSLFSFSSYSVHEPLADRAYWYVHMPGEDTRVKLQDHVKKAAWLEIDGPFPGSSPLSSRISSLFSSFSLLLTFFIFQSFSSLLSFLISFFVFFCLLRQGIGNYSDPGSLFPLHVLPFFPSPAFSLLFRSLLVFSSSASSVHFQLFQLFLFLISSSSWSLLFPYFSLLSFFHRAYRRLQQGNVVMRKMRRGK